MTCYLEKCDVHYYDLLSLVLYIYAELIIFAESMPVQTTVDFFPLALTRYILLPGDESD
jgi:hypothetical protein